MKVLIRKMTVSMRDIFFTVAPTKYRLTTVTAVPFTLCGGLAEPSAGGGGAAGWEPAASFGAGARKPLPPALDNSSKGGSSGGGAVFGV